MNEDNTQEIIDTLTKAYMHIQKLYNALGEGQVCWPAISDSFDWGRITEEEMHEEIESILKSHQRVYFRK